MGKTNQADPIRRGVFASVDGWRSVATASCRQVFGILAANYTGRNSLLRQSYALHQVLKTRIGAQGVELWLDSKLEHGI